MRQIFAATMTMSLMILSASAQLRNQQMQIQIPFAFHVNDVTMTPGLYSVEAQSADLIRFTNIDEKKSVLAITPLKEGRSQTYLPKLVFNRYGSDYFLLKMWFGPETSGRAFLPTPVERELAKNTRPVEIEFVNARQ